jgi:hypothetical protein
MRLVLLPWWLAVQLSYPIYEEQLTAGTNWLRQIHKAIIRTGRFLGGMMSEQARERLGEFLVRIGAMDEGQVGQVLARQKEEPDRLFGEIAIEMGFINDSAVDNFLSSK